MREYTENAKKALAIAKRLAKSLNQTYVGTEHILLGLIKENAGLAARVLLQNGAKADEIEKLIKEFVAPDGSVPVIDREGFSPRALLVIEQAKKAIKVL